MTASRWHARPRAAGPILALVVPFIGFRIVLTR